MMYVMIIMSIMVVSMMNQMAISKEKLYMKQCNIGIMVMTYLLNLIFIIMQNVEKKTFDRDLS